MAEARLRPEPSSPKKCLGGTSLTWRRSQTFTVVYHCAHKEGVLDQKENKLDSFTYQTKRNEETMDTICRDVGRFCRISRASKVCSLHFKRSDISKDLGGRMF